MSIGRKRPVNSSWNGYEKWFNDDNLKRKIFKQRRAINIDNKTKYLTFKDNAQSC